MKSEMGIFMNIVLGIVGAAIASAILELARHHPGGSIGYLIAGFVGACLLIGIVRTFESMVRLTSRVIAEHSARYPCG